MLSDKCFYPVDDLRNLVATPGAAKGCICRISEKMRLRLKGDEDVGSVQHVSAAADIQVNVGYTGPLRGASDLIPTYSNLFLDLVLV